MRFQRFFETCILYTISDKFGQVNSYTINTCTKVIIKNLLKFIFNHKNNFCCFQTVASLPPEQMFQLMQQMKLCIQNNPQEYTHSFLVAQLLIILGLSVHKVFFKHCLKIPSLSLVT